MKQILVMMVAAVSLSVVADEKLIADPIVEKEVRKKLEKLEGELTEADLEKVITLSFNTHNFHNTSITDAGLKEVAKLQRLQELYLDDTKSTDAFSAACTVAVQINTSATGRKMKRLKKWDRLIVNDFMIGSLPSLFEFDVYTLSLFNPKTLRPPNPQSLFARNPLLIDFVNDQQNGIGMSFSKKGI